MNRAFAVRLFLFCLPFASLVLLMFGIGAYLREIMPPYLVLQAARDEKIIYRPVWQPLDFALYKLEASLLYRPKLLILGSSRSVQIHSGIFNRDTQAIYNAGFDAASIRDMAQMMAILEREEALPEVLILQMNTPDFNADMPSITNINIYRPNVLSNFRQVWDGTLWVGRRWRIAASVLNKQLGGTDLTNYWGLIAADTGIGYLPDGSEYNGQLNPELAETLYETDYQTFLERGGNFRAGDRLHEENFASLREIVRIASENGVELLAYFPPYRSGIYDAMLESGDFGYMAVAREAIQQLFDEYGFAFYDFSDIRTVKGRDEELYDSWHPSQVLNMRVFLSLAEMEAALLSPYIDSAVLAQEIAEADNAFFVYEEAPAHDH
jgi:hypothetical protein